LNDLKKYESIFILDSNRFDDGGKAFIENYKSIIQALSGEVIEIMEMGVRQLSHPIKKQSSAIYWDVVFQLYPGKISELKDNFRLDESVLRFVIFLNDRPVVLKTPTKITETSTFNEIPAVVS
jgi:ribosomal protein S6